MSSVSPASGATNVDIDSVISVTFNEAMATSTIDSTTFTLASGATPITGTISFSRDGRTASATLSSATYPIHGSVITVTVTTGVKDLAGNPLTATQTWNFTTTYPYIQWQKCLGGTSVERAYAIHQTSDGGCIETGLFSPTTTM